MLPVWLEPSDPGLGPSSIVSASSRRWRSPRKITPGSRGASRWPTSRLGRSSTSSAADSLFHLAVGLDQLEGAVMTNPIAHQIGSQNRKAVRRSAALLRNRMTLNPSTFGCFLSLAIACSRIAP
jgi:hypothetical protein